VRGDERRAFEQAAEIFFAGVPIPAVSELGIGRGLVTYCEPFELDDADIFTAAFPDLALTQFHGERLPLPGGNRGRGRWKSLLFLGGDFFLRCGFLRFSFGCHNILAFFD
jgi:hypothetical protein